MHGLHSFDQPSYWWCNGSHPTDVEVHLFLQPDSAIIIIIIIEYIMLPNLAESRPCCIMPRISLTFSFHGIRWSSYVLSIWLPIWSLTFGWVVSTPLRRFTSHRSGWRLRQRPPSTHWLKSLLRAHQDLSESMPKSLSHHFFLHKNCPEQNHIV